MRQRFMNASILVLIASLSGCDLLSGFIPPPEVQSVIALSAVPDEDFSANGRAVISILALDPNGDPIINWGLGIEAADQRAGQIKISDISAHTTEKLFASPWAMAIDIDCSGSMSSSDPQYLRKTAAKSFVDMVSGLNGKSEMAVLTFGAGSSASFAKTKLEQDFTSNASSLKAAVDKVTATGGTPLWDSLYELTDWVDSRKSSISWERGILVLSDGGDSGSAKEYTDVADNALDKKIPINCVALGYDNAEMIQLAASTKGIYVKAATAEDLSAAFNAVVLGGSKGYVSFQVTYPKGSIPGAGTTSAIEVAVQGSSGAPKTCTVSLVIPASSK